MLRIHPTTLLYLLIIAQVQQIDVINGFFVQTGCKANPAVDGFVNNSTKNANDILPALKNVHGSNKDLAMYN
jgi:hypothetical protein